MDDLTALCTKYSKHRREEDRLAREKAKARRAAEGYERKLKEYAIEHGISLEELNRRIHLILLETSKKKRRARKKQ